MFHILHCVFIHIISILQRLRYILDIIQYCTCRCHECSVLIRITPRQFYNHLNSSTPNKNDQQKTNRDLLLTFLPRAERTADQNTEDREAEGEALQVWHADDGERRAARTTPAAGTGDGGPINLLGFFDQTVLPRQWLFRQAQTYHIQKSFGRNEVGGKGEQCNWWECGW